MKLAYSTNAFTRTDIFSAVSEIARLGYAGVELLCDHPHIFPGKTPASEIQRLNDLLNSLHLSVSNLNANTANCYFSPLPAENVFEPSLCNPNSDFRKWRIQYTIEAIKIAKILGAKCVSITAGHIASGADLSRCLALFNESLKHICEIAEKENIYIGIEYEPGLLVERAIEVLDVIDTVGSNYLGVNYDIGHSYLENEIPEETISSLSGRIWNVHIEDIKNKKHFHLVPGDGDIPFNKYINALHSIGYSNFLTVELYTYPDIPTQVGKKSKIYLDELMQ